MKLIAGALIVAATGVIAAAQISSPQAPTGTPAPSVTPPAKPLASDAPSSLHGRVVVAETGKPLYRARVRLNRTDGDFNSGREVFTNRDGRYRIDGVAPGMYSILSSHVGFVELRAGQKHPNDIANPFWQIAPGQVQQVDFALSRGGLIAGRLTDDWGEPLAGVEMTPLRVSYSAHGVRFRRSGMPFTVFTNDRGEFRLSGLSPGTYVIAADVFASVVGESYATTYYPGTKNLAEAQRFTIGLNEQVTANFSMMLTRQVRVTGQMRSSTGAPLPGYSATLRTETGLGSRGAQIKDAAGSFEFTGVAPGSYTLDITTARGNFAERRKPFEFASVPIEVGDDDINGLLITTGYGVTVSGRVIYEGTAVKNATPESARVYVNFIDGPRAFGSLYIDRDGRIADDGHFTINGTYGRIMFIPSIPGWQLKSVMLDGVDITDVPYDTRRGGTDRLEIVLTDQQQEVTGTVAGTLREPPGEFIVFVFPRASKAGPVPSRYFGTSVHHGVSDGTFQLPSMPPGDYFAAALRFAPDDALFDPEFREAITPRATPFQLAPGQSVNLELTLIE